MSVSIKNSVSGGGGGITSDEVTAIASDVLKGKTYVGNDTNDEIGTGTLELTGNAGVGDVLSGSTFYNTNAKSKQTGTLALSGNAAVGDVLSGSTFYNTNAKSKQTGTLALSGNATVNDVVYGKTFYNTNAKSKQTGAGTIKLEAIQIPANQKYIIPKGTGIILIEFSGGLGFQNMGLKNKEGYTTAHAITAGIYMDGNVDAASYVRNAIKITFG